MAENKKDVINELVNQVKTYKSDKLNDLIDEITKEKSKANSLIALIKTKREALLLKAEERAAASAKSEADAENIKAAAKDAATDEIASVDKTKEAVKTVSASDSAEAKSVPEKSEAKAVAEKDAEKNASENEKSKANAAEQTLDAASEEKKTEIKHGAAETEKNAQDAPERKTDGETASVKEDKRADGAKSSKAAISEKDADKAAKQEKAEKQNAVKPVAEEKKEDKPKIANPYGERRIYIPPEPPKPKVQTRVFGQGGYSNPRGGRPQQDGANRGGFQQGRPQQTGANGAPRTPRPMGAGGGMGGGFAAPQFNAGGKPGAQKSKGGKPNQNSGSGKFDDRTLNKRALLKKGYIVDDKIMLDDDDVRVRSYKSNKNRGGDSGSAIVIENAIITTDPVPIKVLSEKIGKSAAEIIKTLFFLGIIKTINESIDIDTAELVASEYGITVEYKPDKTMEDTLNAKLTVNEEDDAEKLVGRPPVVTIMGHVDHGKTSLLDYIRSSNVTGGEAGGITQHIGAYTVSLKGSPITFLDTPGHEAFTSMRARGAQVTDIAILVVAADDGIMPQTVEAINHAKQAGVPIIVAVNKMDKTAADPDRVLSQLSEHEVLPEEWGGDTPVVRVSAKTGMGVEELLENILTLAEIKELKANPQRAARGTIIEARLDKGLGKIATILVQTGTLRIGDIVVAGVCTGRIRAMIDDKGRNVKKAGPSTPVSVTGWDDVPEAGDIIDVVPDEKFARDLAEERRLKLAGSAGDSGSVSLTDLFDKIKKGELKSVKLIIKADVQGSLEAVKQSLSKLGNEEVDIDIIHGAVGAIKESDVTLADTAKAIIIGFNVRPDSNAKALAAQKKIDIRFYDIIYNAIEDIEKAVKGLLEPKFEEVVLGSAEVREIFRISGVGVIAGSHVTEGKIVRGAKARLIRDGKVEYTGEIASLRHNKDDVKEMARNFDCGITLTNYQDIKQGDVIEAFRMEQINED